MPSGTVCYWLESKTEAEAWKKLLAEATHPPGISKEFFVKRGFTVELKIDP